MIKLLENSFVLYLGLIAAFLSACDNPFASTPGTQGKNIVTGVFITDEGGGIYSAWGNPKSGGINVKSKDSEVSDEGEVEASSFFSLRPLYPNPADGNMMIQADFPRASTVKIWMETAYLSLQDAESNDYQRFELYDIESVPQGTNVFLMTKKSTCSNGDLRQGFFRVFVQFEDQLLWQDIYIGGVREQAPPGLREFHSVHVCSDYPDLIK
jgi:hypothetical protein